MGADLGPVIADGINADARRKDAEEKHLAQITGAAALRLLNDDAYEWQKARSRELVGDPFTAIDFVKHNLVHWKTVEVLQPKIQAAAHAYKWRSRLSHLSMSLAVLAGGAIGVAGKAVGLMHADAKVSAAMMISGGLATFLVSSLFKPQVVVIHAERAKRWKEQLDALTKAREEALDREDRDP